jgi:hypothetical protein
MCIPLLDSDMTTSQASDALAGSSQNYEHFVEYLHDPDKVIYNKEHTVNK